MRKQSDPLADAVINIYFPSEREALQECLSALNDNSSKLPSKAHSCLKNLYTDVWDQAEKLPIEELKAGQQFFNRHASDIMLLLGMLSLPYCYAAANGAEVLVKSKRILEEPEKRLLETAEFVFNVTSPDAFKPKGKALTDILKVRLMHAAARWYAKNMGDWNVELLGEPVNQEDMAGTNLSFSLIVVRGLKKLGKKVSSGEALEYINYWNLLGRLLGLRSELLPHTSKEAYVLERNIRERQFRPSESGRRLTNSLLQYFETATIDSPLEGRSNSMVAFLLGESVSDILDIKNSADDQLLFQPYRYFFKIQNVLNVKSDSYAAALKQFKEVQKTIE